MKLLSKLTLFITLSKILIVVLFVLMLPLLVGRISFQYTNYYLGEQQKKVEKVIAKNGIDYYLQGDSSYGSYTMLKEEYISLTPAGAKRSDTIETSRRIIEEDTLNYRVLTHQLMANDKRYQLEIGKTIDTIGQYNKLLQRFTLYTLIGLIALSIIIDLVYTNILLRPLARIVRTKLVGKKFPFKEILQPVKTSTTDFRYLDSSLISLMEKIHDAFEKEREFTSNASHELMTPISILQTNIENMMVDEEISDTQQEKIMAMMKTLNRLKKIVHALLYISRIENDQFVKTDTVQLSQLTNEVMEELSHKLELKSIQFNNKLPAGILLRQANHDLLFQLLYNLINNAIRYNKENGSIIISGKYTAGNDYRLSIKDTGIGIRQEELGAIFNRFKRSGQTDGEGYGLGLSIVKSIVQYHNASVEVHSDFGEWTEFVISFPADSIVKPTVNF